MFKYLTIYLLNCENMSKCRPGKLLFDEVEIAKGPETVIYSERRRKRIYRIK